MDSMDPAGRVLSGITDQDGFSVDSNRVAGPVAQAKAHCMAHALRGRLVILRRNTNLASRPD